jgi:hypothetical protein
MFTEHLLSCHQNWTLNGEKETASNGNLGPLSLNLFLGWIQRSWTQVKEDAIRGLFGGEDQELRNGDPAGFNGEDESKEGKGFGSYGWIFG